MWTIIINRYIIIRNLGGFVKGKEKKTYKIKKVQKMRGKIAIAVVKQILQII